MKLLCPKCGTQIASHNVNMQEGIAYCSDCNEFFRIADFLDSDEELRRIQKPHYSKVRSTNTGLKYTLSVPPAGWTGVAFFLLFFAVIWNGVTWGSFAAVEDFDWFLVPFVLVGLLVTAILLFTVYVQTELTIEPEEIRAKWLVLGLTYVRKRKTANLIKITETVMYTQNYQPVYGVGMLFEGEGKLSFGSKLKEEERKWLIGELYDVKAQMEEYRH